jgi:protein SCO1/2
MSWRRSPLVRHGSILLALAAAACTGRPAVPSADHEGGRFGLRGDVLPAPLAKPALLLTDTDRRPFDFRRETDGYLTLLYFGYTHCPDVCPVQMANLGAVITQLTPSVAERIKVVFVTTDPARDTPERLRQWLDNFDPAFIGLTGDTARIAAAERALWLPTSIVGPRDSSGGYQVGHSAAVVAFTPDNLARVMYPFGTRQADWAHDLPKLLTIAWPDSA